MLWCVAVVPPALHVPSTLSAWECSGRTSSPWISRWGAAPHCAKACNRQHVWKALIMLRQVRGQSLIRSTSVCKCQLDPKCKVLGVHVVFAGFGRCVWAGHATRSVHQPSVVLLCPLVQLCCAVFCTPPANAGWVVLPWAPPHRPAGSPTAVVGCVVVQGVVYAGREDLTPDNYLSEVAVETELRTLREAVAGADVFLGLSVSSPAAAPHRFSQGSGLTMAERLQLAGGVEQMHSMWPTLASCFAACMLPGFLLLLLPRLCCCPGDYPVSLSCCLLCPADSPVPLLRSLTCPADSIVLLSQVPQLSRSLSCPADSPVLLLLSRLATCSPRRCCSPWPVILSCLPVPTLCQRLTQRWRGQHGRM